MRPADRRAEYRCGVRRLKGPKRPVNALADRAAVIAAIEAVDAVDQL